MMTRRERVRGWGGRRGRGQRLGWRWGVWGQRRGRGDRIRRAINKECYIMQYVPVLLPLFVQLLGHTRLIEGSLEAQQIAFGR